MRKPVTAQDEFAVLLNDRNLQLEVSKQSLCDFSIRTRNNYPVISDLAIHKLLTVCTTYLYDAAFSTLITIKPKNRYFLKNVENFFLPALANCINLRMDDLCKNHH